MPVQCEFFALEGITQLKETIDFVRSSLNPSLEIHGVVLTMHDSRTKLADEVASEVRSFFGQKVYGTIIPATCAWPKRLRMASRSCSTITRALEAAPIWNSPPR